MLQVCESRGRNPLIHTEMTKIIILYLLISNAEYDVENPRDLTKCEHHFHLSCILEWMERSDSCPICDQVWLLHQFSIT